MGRRAGGAREEEGRGLALGERRGGGRYSGRGEARGVVALDGERLRAWWGFTTVDGERRDGGRGWSRGQARGVTAVFVWIGAEAGREKEGGRWRRRILAVGRHGSQASRRRVRLALGRRRGGGGW
ncbi:hypothetical protein BRADI_4g30425v3 [Brachypodium distachyon]|uniref:DUF834 domain-containing protein n=1 Tax=Brachypodium distachyon TaxID=15368 RepID=A0A0Q3ES15_BRADI|nr:hypothetical protein BRADI_4g30425v3 [Brachypodium distachyon]